MKVKLGIELKAFDYSLPEDLIARFPLVERSSSRLMVLDRQRQTISHYSVRDLPTLLSSKDCLVLNNTKVLPARLWAVKDSGGRAEILIERILTPTLALAHLKVGRAKANMRLNLGEGSIVLIREKQDDLFLLQLDSQYTWLGLLEKIGHMPLPPYIKRGDEAMDHERYQTIYARHPGSVAAPTAGLHFDDALFQALAVKDIVHDFVTLHVGAGTFQPVRMNDIAHHKMHSEYFEVSAHLVEKITTARAQHGRIIAVGTTAVRSLETASIGGTLQACQGETSIFIYPGYHFKSIDGLFTNFHLPRSTLLMLVAAFAGLDFIKAAYALAVEERYRFYSYGDAMLIL